ncbi:MAG TPA: hypothetical protein VGM53_05225, partial [Streptosporangiaceae bacterium]
QQQQPPPGYQQQAYQQGVAERGTAPSSWQQGAGQQGQQQGQQQWQQAQQSWQQTADQPGLQAYPQGQGGPPQDPPRRKIKPWWLAAGGAGIVVIVLIVLVATVFTSGGGSSKSSGSTAAAGKPAGPPAQAWQAYIGQANALGTWSYHDSLVVVTNTQVDAFNQITGKVLWHTSAPPAGKSKTMFCGASPSISGSTAVLGIGVVTDATAAGVDCHSVVSVDLANGKLGWLEQIPSSAQQNAYAKSLDGQMVLAEKGLTVEVSGPNVVASWMGDLAGFSLANGQREWSTALGSGPAATDYSNDVVRDIAISGGTSYIAVNQIEPNAMKVLEVGTTTGKVSRQVTLSKQMTGLSNPTEASILSASPLTIATNQASPSDSSTVVTFSSGLSATGTIRSGPEESNQGAVVGKTLYAVATLGNIDARQYYPFAVGGGLVVGTTLPPNGGGKGNKMIAFSQASGATKWTASVPGTDIIYPVAVTGSTVEMIGVTKAGQGYPEVITLSAATGKVISVGKQRAIGSGGGPPGEATVFFRYVMAGGHVYGVAWSQSKPSPGPGVTPAVFSLS